MKAIILVGISPATIVRLEAAVMRPFASTVIIGIVPTVLPYCAAVTPELASVSAPVLMRVASPERATPVATLDPFPTKIIPLVRVDVSLPLNVVQSVLVRYPLTAPVAAGIEMVFVALESGLVNVSAFSFPLNVVQSPELR